MDHTRPQSAADANDRTWRTLVATVREEPDTDTTAATPRDIATAITANAGREDYERAVLGRLLACARATAGATGHAESATGASPAPASRLSELLGALDAPVLERLLLFAGGPAERLEAVRQLSGPSRPRALVAVLSAAASLLDEDLSEWELRLLHKLAMRTEEPSGPHCEHANRGLRIIAGDMLRQWATRGPPAEAPDGGRPRLGTSPLTGAAEPVHIATTDAVRVLQTCMEIGEAGPVAIRALQALEMRGEQTLAIDILNRAPIDGKALDRLWGQIATVETVRSLLALDPPDFKRLDAVLPRVGLDAARPMLHLLADCDSRTVRRGLFDRLRGFGSALLPAVMEWLDDERWFVKRNMLVLLQELGSWPEGIVPAAPFLGHEHASVRREAIKLFLSVPGERDAALNAALDDADATIMTLGLAAAEGHCPDWAVPKVCALLGRPDLPAKERLHAIRALGRSDEAAALDGLLRVVMRRDFLPFRRRLAPTSPELLLALEYIETSWSSDPRAARALKLARSSRDPAVREAVRGAGRTPPDSPPADPGRAAAPQPAGDE